MNAQDAELEPGQIWVLRPGNGGERPTATVLVVENLDGIGEVVHVALDGLHMPNPIDPDRPNTSIGHLPMTGEVLRPALVELVGHHEGPLDLEGYDYWRSENGGVFTVPVV